MSSKKDKNSTQASQEHSRTDGSIKAQLTVSAEDNSKPFAFVNRASVMCFAAGVSEQRQSDVLNSTLLAQLEAEDKYDRYVEEVEWHGHYNNTLTEIVRCMLLNYYRTKWHTYSKQFTLEDAILYEAEVQLTESEFDVMVKTLTALKGLPKDDPRLKFFNQWSSYDNMGNFHICFCRESEGTVYMTLMSFAYRADVSNRDVLFYSYNTDSIDLYTANQVVNMNDSTYDEQREDVLTRLDHALEMEHTQKSENIFEIDI